VLISVLKHCAYGQQVNGFVPHGDNSGHTVFATVTAVVASRNVTGLMDGHNELFVSTCNCIANVMHVRQEDTQVSFKRLHTSTGIMGTEVGPGVVVIGRVVMTGVVTGRVVGGRVVGKHPFPAHCTKHVRFAVRYAATTVVRLVLFTPSVKRLGFARTPSKQALSVANVMLDKMKRSKPSSTQRLLVQEVTFGPHAALMKETTLRNAVELPQTSESSNARTRRPFAQLKQLSKQSGLTHVGRTGQINGGVMSTSVTQSVQLSMPGVVTSQVTLDDFDVIMLHER
jgi:hypothetical protein